MSGSGPSCNRRLITAGEAKSRNGTQLLPAALNYFSTTGFPFPSFSLPLLVSAASLFVFDLSLSCLFLSLPVFLNLNILPPHPHPSASLFIYFLISLSLSTHSLWGPCRVQWVWSFRLVLLSLLRVLERPIYQ